LPETLREYGQFTRIALFETGEGSYSMEHERSSCMAMAEIGASKPLLLEGWGTGWSVDFNWITPIWKASCPHEYCDGFNMADNSLGGLNAFRSNPGDSWEKCSESYSATVYILGDQNSLLNPGLKLIIMACLEWFLLSLKPAGCGCNSTLKLIRLLSLMPDSVSR
jgi:hypothetical protein